LGLRRLEHRDYDPAGVATINRGGLIVKKDVGGVDEVNSRLNLEDMPGTTGIVHTR